jgi:16S rRNA processing protein RimM
MSTSSKNKNEDSTQRKISIGYVSAAHGVKGEVRIVPLTDFPERFNSMDVLNLYLNGVLVSKLKVSRVRSHESRGELIIESDVSDRNEAERLVGASVLIEPEDRVTLPEDSFWVDDLIGLSVVDNEGKVLGVVEGLLSTGGTEVYEVGKERVHQCSVSATNRTGLIHRHAASKNL